MLAELAQYPFARLDDWKADATARGIELIDFGMGDPREVTPAFIREALVDSIEPVSSYPRATGLPELRDRDRRLARPPLRRRRRRHGDRPDARLEGGDLLVRAGRARRQATRRDSRAGLPRLRARRAVRRRQRRNRAAEREERLAARPRRLRRVGRDRALLGLLPEQPDGSRRAARFLRGARGARARARLPRLLRRGVLRAVVRRATGVGAAGRGPRQRRRLQHAVEALVDDRLPLGLRLRADEIVDALRAFRPTVGTAPQEFVQRASVAAWSDDEHVADVRDIYRRKRETLLPAFEEAGFRLAGSIATFYLWLDCGGPSEEVARRLLEHGIVLAPGSFFGAAGEGYVRVALVPTQAECERAAAIIRERL